MVPVVKIDKMIKIIISTCRLFLDIPCNVCVFVSATIKNQWRWLLFSPPSTVAPT